MHSPPMGLMTTRAIRHPPSGIRARGVQQEALTCLKSASISDVTSASALIAKSKKDARAACHHSRMGAPRLVFKTASRAAHGK